MRGKDPETGEFLSPSRSDQRRAALDVLALGGRLAVLTDAQLEKLLADQPEEIQDEILSINTDTRPLALQVALLVPILAGLLGLFTSLRMMRRPDPVASQSAEMALA